MAKLDHVAIEVSNMDKAIEFYTSNLGFLLKSRAINRECNEEYCFLESEGLNLELLTDIKKQYITPKTIKNPYCPHICFVSDNLEKTIKDLKSKQIEIIHGPLITEGESTWLYFSDPDGNILEYVQWYK